MMYVDGDDDDVDGDDDDDYDDDDDNNDDSAKMYLTLAQEETSWCAVPR